MNVRFGLAWLALVISCWCCTTSFVTAASNGIRPRRQSRRATLNEYLTPPAPPNGHVNRGTGPPRNPRNYPHPGASKSSSGPSFSSPYRHGKILTPPSSSNPQSQGYFARLMGWLNPFGGGSPPQRAPLSAQQHRPDNGHQGTNFNSGYLQPPPGPNGPSAGTSYGPPASAYGAPLSPHGSPASSYGPPTNSYESYAPGQSLPRPPSPQGSNGYHPQQQGKNCNPCNQVPWVPLYKGVNGVDSRYASGSIDLKPPESTDTSTSHQNQNSGSTNFYQTPSLSHEIKTPDFGYGISSVVPNHQQFPLQSNNHQQNQNLNFHQTEYRSPFTGPIPNPHLYPGAMPPLFKAKPFDSQPQGTDTSLVPPAISQSNYQSSFSSGGEISANGNSGNEFGHSSSTHIQVQDQYNPSSDLNSQFPGSQNHQNVHQQFQNAGNGYNPSYDDQRNQAAQSGSHLDDGYVDELPPGAETFSGPEDQFAPSSSDHHQIPNDNGASNSDFTQTFHGSNNHESTSDTKSIVFDANGQTDFQANGNSGNGNNQATSYGGQLSTDGQHVIHYEQSPVIDLSADTVDEKRKESNDSSASSSTDTDAVEEPPVVLQNADGTYGINATWSGGDSSKILWPDDDANDFNVAPVTAASIPEEYSSGSGSYVRFDDVRASPSSVDILVGPTSQGSENYGPGFVGYADQLPQNDTGSSGSLNLKNDSQPNEQTYDEQKNGNSDDTAQDHFGLTGNIETARQQNQFSPYPGLISYDHGESFGFRLPDPPVRSTTDQPFLQALMKSYDNFKKDEAKNEAHSGRDRGSGRTWFDSQPIHPGEGFQPSRVISGDFGEVHSRPTNRQQGAKRNKQVQIIIPYTSQYTPKPFHPSPEDWSTKTTPGKAQARKVPIYDKNQDYLAQETKRVEAEVSQIFKSLENSSRSKDVTRSPTGVKANTSIDVLRLQKNIDNWTIQEYSRGTTASMTIVKSSRPYLSPSKQIPNEYLTTTEPVQTATDSIENSRKDISNVLAGFSFNDLEHEASASDQVDISHVEVSPHLNEVSSVLPEELEATTATAITTTTTERDSWKQLPVSISPLNKERVYVVTPQSVSTTAMKHNKSEDKSVGNDSTRNPKNEKDLIQFETIERAYQVLPQAVNNLAVASTGPATIPLWGIMEHEEYASTVNKNTTVTNPILYAGHSKVSHTKQ